MNKSKFLKKSLAMILAVMLVVAMIPLGASAAVPTVTSVTVNNEKAVLSGDTYSTTITPTPITDQDDVNIVVILAQGAGKLFHDGTMLNGTPAEADGQFTFNPTPAEFAAKHVTFQVWDNAVEEYKEYKIDWTYAERNTDNTLASIAFTNATSQYGPAYNDSGVTVLTAAYHIATTASETLTAKCNAKSEITSSDVTANLADPSVPGVYTITGYTLGEVFRLTVTAENGSARTYSIKVVNPDYFPTFSIEGERKAAKIDVTGTTTGTIALYLPYDQATVTKGGTKYYEVTPTFTTGYPSATVKSVAVSAPNEVSEKAFKSGDKLYLDATAGTGTFPIIYSYTTTGALGAITTTDVTFTVTYNVPTEDPKAEIKAIRIGNYNGKVDGTNLTVELPATYMAANPTVALQAKASDGSAVKFVGNPAAGITNADGTFQDIVSPYSVAAESTGIIRVTSGWTTDEDGETVGPAVTDYNFSVKKVGISEAATMKAFILEDPNGDQYPATFDHAKNKITVKVPYSTDRATMSGAWKLYYESSNGSTVALDNGHTLIPSGDAIDADTLNAIPTTFDGKTASADKVIVTASDNTTKEYYVYVGLLDAEKGKSITSFKVTPETDYDELTDDNTFKGTINGRNITVNVPFSKYDGTASGGAYDFAAANVVAQFEASKGAKVWYITNPSNGAATQLTGITEDTDGVAISVAGADFDGTDTSATDKTPKTLTLVVTSEAAADITNFDDTYKGNNAGLFTTYTLKVVKQTARTDVRNVKAYLFDNVTKEKVSGAVNVAAGTVTFSNIPYHFIEDSQAAGGVYFDYEVVNGEAVGDSKGSLWAPITYTAAGNYASGGKKVAFTAASGNILTEDGGFAQLYVESEDGVKGTGTATTALTMNISYTAAAAEKGATMTSMTINNVTARPDNTNAITINLPYGTEVTALKPSWVVSKNAVVTYNGAQIISGETAINFTTPQKFKVISEDKMDDTTYTVTVTTAAQFTDVKPGSWYYDAVMNATAKGIIYGMGDGTFRPNQNVTREQFAQFIARTDGYNKADYADKATFSDLKDCSDDAKAAIAYCADKGYIKGMGDTTFAPKATITREQMAVILAAVMNYSPVTTPKETFTDDAQIAGWAKGYVYACVENELLKGMGDGTYAPKGNATRAQAATVCMEVSENK